MVGELSALASAACWAFSSVLIKDLTARLSAFSIMAVRMTVGALLTILIVAALRQGHTVWDIPPGTVLLLLGTGLMAVAGDVVFVRSITVDDLSRMLTVSTSVYITVSVAASILFAGEPLTWLTVLGGVLVLVGIYLTVGASGRDGHRTGATAPLRRTPMLGLWLAIVAGVLWAINLLGVSYAMQSATPLAATALRIPLMALLMLTVIGVRGDLRRRRPTRRDSVALAMSGVLVVGSIMLFLVAARLTSASVLAVLSSTAPAFAVPMAFLFLRERITRRVVEGTTMCMLGIWFTVL